MLLVTQTCGNTAGVGSSQVMETSGVSTDGIIFGDPRQQDNRTGYDKLVFINSVMVVGRVTTSGSSTSYSTSSQLSFERKCNRCLMKDLNKQVLVQVTIQLHCK